MRKAFVMSLALAGLGMVACGSDPEPTPAPVVAIPTSGFDADDDGWTIVGDAKETKPVYSPTGGNPTGLISAKDDAVGGVWFYHAPAKFLGDQSQAHGKAISFDLKTTNVSNPFDDVDVKLEGAGMKLVFDTQRVSSPDQWTHFTVRLDASAGWKKDTLKGAAATDDELKAVLKNLTKLEIRGEFNTGQDTGSMDNPKLGSVE